MSISVKIEMYFEINSVFFYFRKRKFNKQKIRQSSNEVKPALLN